MTDILLTAVIPIVMAVILLWNNTRDRNNKFFFSKDYTSTLKGMCALVVIFVHVPEGYINPLQDAIGSFAFVAVTIFFMFSAYGMLYSMEHKAAYMQHFWRNRLLSLIVPNIVVDCALFLLYKCFADSVSLTLLYEINRYVVILLEFCVLFYVVSYARRRFRVITPMVADIIMIVAVVASSLVIYLLKASDPNPHLDWCYERLGLVWGILLYRYFDKFKAWIGRCSILWRVVAVTVAIALGVAYLKFKHEWFVGEYLLKIILGLSIILAMMLVMEGRRYNNAATRFLGAVSFEIYLAHVYIMALIIENVPDISSGIFMVFTVACTIVFSWATHMLSSKIIARYRR